MVRLLSGATPDRGIRCSWPVRHTLLAIAADLILLQADNYNSYLLGQLLLGCAAGLYWPAIDQSSPRVAATFLRTATPWCAVPMPSASALAR